MKTMPYVTLMYVRAYVSPAYVRAYVEAVEALHKSVYKQLMNADASILQTNSYPLNYPLAEEVGEIITAVFSTEDVLGFQKYEFDDKQKKQRDSMDAVLQKAGWYYSDVMDSDADEIQRFLREKPRTAAEVDAFLVELFRRDTLKLLKALIRKWNQLPCYDRRCYVWKDAQICYSYKRFIAVVTLLSVHTEGVISDFYLEQIESADYFILNKKHIKVIQKRLVERGIIDENHSLMSWLLDTFLERFHPGGEGAEESRHRFAHGQAYKLQTEAYALKRFLCLDQLFGLLVRLD
jgi:hypothetical protein